MTKEEYVHFSLNVQLLESVHEQSCQAKIDEECQMFSVLHQYGSLMQLGSVKTTQFTMIGISMCMHT